MLIPVLPRPFGGFFKIARNLCWQYGICPAFRTTERPTIYIDLCLSNELLSPHDMVTKASPTRKLAGKSTLSSGEMTRNKDRRQHAKSATDRRHAKSAAALREALLSLLQRKPYDQITVVEICAEAGVHNATFFRHHTDKDALLDHVAADEIKSLVDISLPLGMELAGSRALCEYVHNRWTLWKALLNGGAGPAMRAEYLRISRKVAADVGRKSRWLPHELSIVLSTMMIVETLSWWLDQDPDAAGIDEVANIIDRLIHVPALDEPPPNRG